jgi:hypothetical protein
MSELTIENLRRPPEESEDPILHQRVPLGEHPDQLTEGIKMLSTALANV